MERIVTYLKSLREPLKLLQLLAIAGGLFVVFTLLSATGGKPKPWDDAGPQYLVGEMEGFTRTFPSKPLPNIPLESDEGRISLRQVAPGKALVVNLWATWCAPCLEELPSLSALQEAMGEDVVVLAVAEEGGDGTRQQAMMERVGAENLKVLRDPKLALGRAYSDNLQLPITVLYDNQGREIGRLSGAADWSSPEAERLVRAVASGAVPR